MKKENDLNGVFGQLLPELGRAVSEAGYTTPSPIQEQSIPSLLKGRDMIGCAQTGTGKTAAFSLPILQYLVSNKKRPVPGKPRVLILAPTRELAAQIGDSIAKYGKHTRITQTVIFGEVGLTGEVRAVSQPELRIKEAARLGFNRCILPQGNLKNLTSPKGMTLVGIRHASELLDLVFT